MENFIRVKDGLVSPEKCRKIIELFDNYHENGLTFNRRDTEEVSKVHKDDDAMGYVFQYNFQAEEYIGATLLNEELKELIHEYIDEFNSLHHIDMAIKNYKIQKTAPKGGYHVWHFENDCPKMSHRVLVFTIYLNTIEEGGETEFLYQSLRVAPKAGRGVIWPAGYTHPHRGNPPLGTEDKYIVTGWVEYQ